MSGRNGRWWAVGAVVALAVGALSWIQSIGYWVLSAAGATDPGFLFVDHDGPSVTSALIGTAALAIGGFCAVKAARTARRAD
jgi:hypothetical protein